MSPVHIQKGSGNLYRKALGIDIPNTTRWRWPACRRVKLLEPGETDVVARYLISTIHYTFFVSSNRYKNSGERDGGGDEQDCIPQKVPRPTEGVWKSLH